MVTPSPNLICIGDKQVNQYLLFDTPHISNRRFRSFDGNEIFVNIVARYCSIFGELCHKYIVTIRKDQNSGSWK